ncbi:hypothetical protein TIFTF001_051481 [Ficus carica]|uniref:Uncharacterized protein n=1 Tax=Ficus carica TaxID=3494 RepID=A0AA87ZGN5_FICCA|nr:hypothetical protein TIFTF001_051481 [Ficus carica]
MLHDTGYSSNANGNLMSRRLSGLVPNSNLTKNGRAKGSERFSSSTEKHRCLGLMKEQRAVAPCISRTQQRIIVVVAARDSRFQLQRVALHSSLVGLPPALKFTVRRGHREAEKNDMLFEEVEPNVIFEEQDLCNLGVKHTLGFAGNTSEENSVFVAISSIEQSLCLVDQSSAKDNFNKCDIVTEALELIPTYMEHITIPHTNLKEFVVKSQELTCGSVDLSLDNILKPYKVDLQRQDLKQQVQVFLGRTSYEFTKGCSISNGQNQCNLCKELVIMWKMSLLPLWIWDKLRRDFSVGVYHSHKTNRLPSSSTFRASFIPHFRWPCRLLHDSPFHTL